MDKMQEVKKTELILDNETLDWIANDSYQCFLDFHAEQDVECYLEQENIEATLDEKNLIVEHVRARL